MREMTVAIAIFLFVMLIMGGYMGEKYSDTVHAGTISTLTRERDSLQAELSEYKVNFREHLKECSWISKSQIKSVTNGIYITLYKPYEEHE